MANPNYLSDLEIDKIEAFCKDEVLYETVKKVLLAGIYHNAVAKPDQPFEFKNPAFNFISNAYAGEKVVSDAEIGANLRGLFEGVHHAASVFDQLKSIKKEEEVVESPYNQAV